jgi:hypothetical protein
VTRLVLLCLVPILLALPAAADCLDDIKAQLAEINTRLAAGSVPPAGVPTLPTVPTPAPETPPATPTANCNGAGPYVINGRGDVYNVCTCSPAVVRIRNAMPGSTISWAKIPGTGERAIPLGMVTATDGGRVIGASGGVASTTFDIGIGDRDIVFTSEARCTNLVVTVR